MKKEAFLFILKLYAAYLLVFVAFKPVFILYNGSNGVLFSDYLQVMAHGFAMDMSTASYFVVLPLLVTLVASWTKLQGKGLKVFFYIYFGLAALAISTGLLVDCVLYDFWLFKLDATVLNYIDSPKDVFASVPFGLALLGIVAIILVALLLFGLQCRAARRFLQHAVKPEYPGMRLVQTLLLVLTGGLLFLAMRGGTGESTMNIGKAYYSEKQFLNYSAVNPIFSFVSSAFKAQDFANEYRFFEEDEADKLYQELDIEATTQEATDYNNVLRCIRPNVVLLLTEGFSAGFIEPLGGDSNVTPCFNQLAGEGVLFSRCYANSFRTDRGTVSTLSGYCAFPNISVMKMPQKSKFLPSIAQSLKNNGYNTRFLYGGDINFTNMKSYLISTGYETVQGDEHFPAEARKSHAWGAQDHIVLDTVAQHLLRYQQKHATDDKPLFLTCLTLSSHEPWQVPYHRIENNERANAMAYTDSCIGAFVQTMKEHNLWDNLLLIIVADHGISYPGGITEANPERSHIPLLFTGGAIDTAMVVNKYCNQSDLPATLLASMQIPQKEYRFSRNVLSENYRYPFAFHTFSGGMTFIDSTGVTIYDIAADKVITDSPQPSALRLARAKAYLQKAMQDFDQLGRLHDYDTDKTTNDTFHTKKEKQR